jgi:uncharacterized membrane protein YfcA
MMGFSVFLPVAGTTISIAVPICLGGLVGFLSGLFGVGGGFLMTPLLMMIGIPATVAAASDSNQIVAASASGTLAHARAGAVDLKMGVLLLIGGVAGGSIGVVLIRFLRTMGQADLFIRLVYIVMLGGIGSYMFFESLSSMRRAKSAVQKASKPSLAYARLMNMLPWTMEFRRSGLTLSALVPLFFGVLVGILAAIMGVGGGFIMVPVMVYLLRMPMHVVVGTSLFQILFTCVNVTVMQAALNHTVDLILALLLLVGSVIGAQIGARVNRRLKGDQLKILMAVIVLAVMAKMLFDIVIRPDFLVAYKGGH